MADIRRDVGDVSPNTYIRPGVEDNSMSTIVGGLAEQGIKLDTTLAQHRLYEEVDAIATQREIGSPVGIAAQEQAAAGVDPSAAPAVQGLEGELARAQSAYKQGRMSHDQMMILSERAVRKAIARRPGLAQEFRALAAQRVGRDVVGASIDFLAQKDADALTAASKAAQEEAEQQDQLDKRRLEEIQKAGGTIGDLTSSEAIEARWLSMQDSIRDRARLEVTANMATAQRTTHEASLVLRREADTNAFLAQSAQKRVQMVDTVNGLINGLRSGAPLDDTSLADVLVDVRNAAQDYVAWADQARASGTVDPTVITNTQDVLKLQLANLETLISGDLPLDVKKKRLENELLVAKEALLLEEPQLRAYGAAVEVLGPQAVANMVAQPGQQLPKRMVLAVGQVVAKNDDPRVTTNIAGDIVGTTVAENFGRDADPELVSKSLNLFSEMALRFVTIPDDQAVQKDLTGPNGFIHKLDLHKQQIKAKADPTDAGRLAGNVAVAAHAAQRRLQIGLYGEMPSLRDKVEARVAVDGALFHVKQGAQLTPAEQAVLVKYNQGWSGHKVLRTVAYLTYGDESRESLLKASQLISGAGGRVQELQAQGTGGSSAPPPRRPTQARTGGSEGLRGPSDRWWEQ